VAGKVKVTESPLNAVTVDEPKKLTGSSQNGNASGTPTSTLGYTDKRCTADRRDLTQQNVTKRNEASLMSRRVGTRQAGPQGELMGQQVEDGTGSERGSVIGPIETSCLTVKAGRLVPGHHREITRRTVPQRGYANDCIGEN
jgi:hypothetical protein